MTVSSGANVVVRDMQPRIVATYMQCAAVQHSAALGRWIMMGSPCVVGVVLVEVQLVPADHRLPSPVPDIDPQQNN